MRMYITSYDCSDKQRAIVEAICQIYFNGQALQAGLILEEEDT
jgi:hypothetical protein